MTAITVADRHPRRVVLVASRKRRGTRRRHALAVSGSCDRIHRQHAREPRRCGQRTGCQHHPREQSHRKHGMEAAGMRAWKAAHAASIVVAHRQLNSGAGFMRFAKPSTYRPMLTQGCKPLPDQSPHWPGICGVSTSTRHPPTLYWQANVHPSSRCPAQPRHDAPEKPALRDGWPRARKAGHPARPESSCIAAGVHTQVHRSRTDDTTPGQLQAHARAAHCFAENGRSRWRCRPGSRVGALPALHG